MSPVDAPVIAPATPRPLLCIDTSLKAKYAGDAFVTSTKSSNNANTVGRWTHEEHQLFVKGIQQYGKSWKKIAQLIRTRTLVQIRTHAQKYLAKKKLSGEKAAEMMTLKTMSSHGAFTMDGPAFHGFGLPFGSNSIPMAAMLDSSMNHFAAYTARLAGARMPAMAQPIAKKDMDPLPLTDIDRESSPSGVDNFDNWNGSEDNFDFMFDDEDSLNWLDGDDILELGTPGKESTYNPYIIRPEADVKVKEAPQPVKRRRIEPIRSQQTPVVMPLMSSTMEFNPYMWTPANFMAVSQIRTT